MIKVIILIFLKVINDCVMHSAFFMFNLIDNSWTYMKYSVFHCTLVYNNSELHHIVVCTSHYCDTAYSNIRSTMLKHIPLINLCIWHLLRLCGQRIFPIFKRSCKNSEIIFHTYISYCTYTKVNNFISLYYLEDILNVICMKYYEIGIIYKH